MTQQRRPIVVGVDGSRESDNALRYAFARAERTGAELVAVHGWSVDDPADASLARTLTPASGPAEAQTQGRTAGETAGETSGETSGRTSPGAWGGDPAEWAGRQTVALDDWLAPYAERYPTVRTRPVSVHGHPVQALVEQARGASLVVVGNRGRGGFRGLLLGSVGMELLREAPCPVAIVRY